MQRAARLVRTSVLNLKTLQGRRNDLIANFLTGMEPLFAKKEADRMEEEIREHKYWK